MTINKETIKNAVENALLKNIFNDCPTMIHEKDYRCCSDCDANKVMPARIGNVSPSSVIKMSMSEFMNSKYFGKTKSIYDVQDDDFYQTEFGKQYLKDKKLFSVKKYTFECCCLNTCPKRTIF